MKLTKRRKCLCCKVFFIVDACNVRHQHFCPKADCRKASKVASQRAWLAKPENHDYFHGPENVARVRAWRDANPGYGKGKRKGSALQDDYPVQVIESKENSSIIVPMALQDVLLAQPLVLIGLIAHISGSTLQDDLDRSTRQLLKLGEDILGRRAGDDGQERAMPRADAADSGAFQLGRP